jgi:hypothetical protein
MANKLTRNIPDAYRYATTRRIWGNPPGSIQGYGVNAAFNNAKASESRNDLEKALLRDVGAGRKYN